ncbi:MAG: asparagine synthase (glutamine-hydrolyzing) [Bacteroidota bacterium]|nr:asparagine synthase (glutamine-hydrolyzing) [Bacteroidota bacterium]
MCGIAGAVNFDLSYSNINSTMHHRGPDEQGGYTSGAVNFFHLRLSILDIGGGKQPMHLHNKYTIIFNGEIYNHSELRKQFNLEGQTSSDTETLLLLYEKLGAEFLNHLDGMFAFAIHDKEKNTVFIARDRAGKKPLYFYKDNEKIVFASELNCLKGLLPLQIDEQNFYHYLRLGSFYRELTPYKNVTELQAGNYLIVNCETLGVQHLRWWNIHDFYLKENNDSFETSLNTVNRLLHTSVKRRLESSDLEVGCFLSGGIDSGLTTAIASEYNNKLKTFTVSFNGEYNEAPLARLVAEKYNTHHTEINISFDNIKNDLEEILSNYGEPFFDSSAIPSYYVSREAKKYLTVIINGDGADELFGGYRRYVPFSKYDFFKKNLLVKSGATFIKNILPISNSKKSKYNYLYRLASLASKSNLDIYLSAGVDIFEDLENNITADYDYLKKIKNDFDAIAGSKLSGLKKIMNMDFDTNLFSDLLVKMDIATMANSLEGRSPFLSKELLEYVPSMNDKYKINGGTTKYLLRTLAKKYLPEQLIDQPKRGFEIPLKDWVNGQLKEMVNDYITSSTSLNKKLINHRFVNNLLENKIKISQEKRAKILWTIFAMEVWHKKVYLNN